MRGFQKKVIYIQNTGNPAFEEAYFILSDRADPLPDDGADMVEEATRILSERIFLPHAKTVLPHRGEKTLRFRQRFTGFFGGFLSGVLAATAISLLLALLLFLFFLHRG